MGKMTIREGLNSYGPSRHPRSWFGLIALSFIFFCYFFNAREYSDNFSESSTGAPDGQSVPIHPAHTTLSEPPTQPPSDVQAPPEDKNRRLVVIVSATDPSPDICKFILTAIALGYPRPIIVNWGLDYHSVSKWKNGKGLIKTVGIVKYLDAALHPNAHPDEKLDEDDLVLMSDGSDVWFQLPPDILLARFHRSNARANARLREQWHGNSPMPMRQTIVTACQKTCYPAISSGQNLRCHLLPESPLRADLYGPETDKNETLGHDSRPRFINGGSYMGPAGDMRRMFRRAQSIMDAYIGTGMKVRSEQGLVGEMLGEQEVWRQWMRKQNSAGDEAMAMMEQTYEYHIGLDYDQELSIPTVLAHQDGVFIKLNNQAEIEAHSAERQISPVRLKGLPDDIKATQNPLANVTENPDWGEMPLYADFFTESVTVMLHHNAHVDNLKQRRVLWWDQTWLFPHLRELVARSLTPREPTPLATVQTEDGGITYWAPPLDSVRRKPRVFFDSVVEPMIGGDFNTMCRYPDEQPDVGPHWWDEVFRDGKGPI
ncbi:hypothetical protein EDB80DRAFT_718183 [Ilyonectria destructans]|nr:hypothetical protein EDB80DRAFT_718183 [Ilyonectria destructans]